MPSRSERQEVIERKEFYPLWGATKKLFSRALRPSAVVAGASTTDNPLSGAASIRKRIKSSCPERIV